MKKAEFETWLAAKGYRPIAKVTTPDGDLLIAEGDFDYPEYHHRTLWLVDKGGPLFGRHVNHRRWDTFGGVLQPATRELRVKEAVEDAMTCLGAGHLMPEVSPGYIS